ncbi:MAG: M48 family metallopeptidase [Pseudomonadota bacterium]|nr:M48 family metallopeptidase [Pseudomonadota bacterium]MDE3037595.1 M48 family metallopeptidase [Pseudomonadota bacterium]
MDHTILIGGEHLPVLVRRHRAARRFTVRYQPSRHAVSLTLPRYASLRQALRFVEEKRAWLARQIEKKPVRVPFADGQMIPLLGRNVRLCHKGGRGVVAVGNDCIRVPGDAAFMARRVREWIKAQAKEEMVKRAQEYARELGVTVKKITLRDTGSHWGSCTGNGGLSLSWRLALAPCEVLEYVVAHEVAHIAQHNHSPAFWALVERLCPHHKTAKAWLRAHGAALHAYG